MSIHTLQATGKSKALAATLSDTKAKTKSNDSDDEGILMPSPLQSILLKGLRKLLMKKKTWWSQNLKRWMSKMTSIQPMQNYTRSRKSMRNYIGWPPRS